MDFIKENLKEVTVADKITDVVIFEKGSNVPKRTKISKLKGYTEYYAILNQSGTAAPVATIITSDITGTISFVRDGVGQYSLLINNASFIADKTYYSITPNSLSLASNDDMRITRIDNSTFWIYTYKTGAGDDSILSNTPITIRIKN